MDDHETVDNWDQGAELDDRHVTHRAVGELVSRLSRLYVSGSGLAEKTLSQEDIALQEPPMEDKLTQLAARLEELEFDCNAARQSTVNREESLRQYINQQVERLQNLIQTSVETLEKEVVNCIERRDLAWKEEIKKLTLQTSTPLVRAAPSRCTWDLSKPDFTFERPVAATTAIGATNPPIPTPRMRTLSAKLPVRINFPEFGEGEGNGDAVSYVELCEEFLALRPMSNPEIMATLSSVLKGPAKSWWIAERNNIQTWSHFKSSFLRAFLSTDFVTEIEDRVRDRVQAPGESIRDFAYDFRALCMRWRPDMPEREFVRRILNNSNPKLAACLRGSVKTVEELVSVGSMVEKDWSGQKQYWAKQNSKFPSTSEKGERRATRGGAHKADVGVHRHAVRPRGQYDLPGPTLLVIRISVRDVGMTALLDTGCTYTLLKNKLWQQVKRPGETLTPCKEQTFVLADGQTHGALGKKKPDF